MAVGGSATQTRMGAKLRPLFISGAWAREVVKSSRKARRGDPGVRVPIPMTQALTPGFHHQMLLVYATHTP